MTAPTLPLLRGDTLENITAENVHDVPAEQILTLTEDTLNSVLVKITNDYGSRVNGLIVRLLPPENDAEAIDAWWNETVFEQTGDGLGGDANTEVIVLSSPVLHLPIGSDYGWDG